MPGDNTKETEKERLTSNCSMWKTNLKTLKEKEKKIELLKKKLDEAKSALKPSAPGQIVDDLDFLQGKVNIAENELLQDCLLYTSDAADE